MKCPRCGSSDVTVQAVVEHHLVDAGKKRHGILWWIAIGWWFAPAWWLLKFVFRWVVLFPLTLISKALGWGRGKRYDMTNETRAKAVCQTCGHVWEP